MALDFKFSTCQTSDCSQITLKDNTGTYHGTYNTGGWGGDISTPSTTSVLIGTGSKTFTVGGGLNFVAGQTVTATYNGSNYMTGTVTSYNSITGALVLNITSVTGAGTYAVWTIAFSGGNFSTDEVEAVVVVVTDPSENTHTVNAETIVMGQMFSFNYTDLGVTVLEDGLYTVVVTLTINGVDYTYTMKFFSTCNIQCCIFKKLKEAKEKALSCDGCEGDIYFELFTWTRWLTLKKMAAGCDTAGATIELAKLQELCGQNVDCGCS